jgi:hypothetical protein
MEQTLSVLAIYSKHSAFWTMGRIKEPESPARVPKWRLPNGFPNS